MLKPYKGYLIAKRVGISSATARGAVKTAATEEKSLKVEIIYGDDETSKGSIVIIKKYTGDEYEYDGDLLLFITPSDILAEEIA